MVDKGTSRRDMTNLLLFLYLTAFFILGGLLAYIKAYDGAGDREAIITQVDVIREVALPEDIKLVALTFDDGPNPYYTPKILELLREYRAKATFFVVGEQAEKYPELLVEEVKAKHQIGNHGYRHTDYRRLSSMHFLAEVDKAESVISKAIGKKPTVFRPPLGKYRNSMVNIMKDRNYDFILWTYATNSEDSWKNPPAWVIADTIMKGVRPGAIILLHDHGGNRRTTVDAVGRVLKGLTGKGYRFVTLDTLLIAGRVPLNTADKKNAGR